MSKGNCDHSGSKPSIREKEDRTRASVEGSGLAQTPNSVGIRSLSPDPVFQIAIMPVLSPNFSCRISILSRTASSRFDIVVFGALRR